MPAINMVLSIGFPGAERHETVHVSPEEWNSMDDAGKESYIESCEQEFLNDYVQVSTNIEND